MYSTWRDPYNMGGRKPGTAARISSELADRIAAEMKQQGLDDAALARKVGVQRPSIQRIRTKRVRSSARLDAICKELGIVRGIVDDSPEEQLLRAYRDLAGVDPEEAARLLVAFEHDCLDRMEAKAREIIEVVERAKSRRPSPGVQGSAQPVPSGRTGRQ